jgi:hypothetical protein
LPELENMTELMKRPSQKRLPNHQAFIEALIHWVAVKSISFPLVNHLLLQDMVQRAHSEFSVPVDDTLKHDIKRLAEIDRQLPERQEKSRCFLRGDEEKHSADVFW